MKFPESGRISSRGFGWGAGLFARASGSGNRRRAGKENAAPSVKLTAQLQLLGDRLITAQVGGLQIIQQPAALADHHQKTTARAVILLVRLQMLGQMVDALGEQR